MNIWYFCLNPNISLRNAHFAPSLHSKATIESLAALGHEVSHFMYADEYAPEDKFRRSTRKVGRGKAVLRRAKPFLRDVVELYQNLARDQSIIEPIFRNNAIDLAYERLFSSKSTVSACARKYGVPIIVEGEAPVAERKLYWGSPLAMVIDQLEKRILLRADAITVVSMPLKRYYEKRGIAANKIYVLPNAVDVERFSPETVSDNVRATLGLGDKTVIGFVGNIMPYHGAELFLPMARTFSTSGKDVHFLIVGGGPEREKLQAALVRENLERYFTIVGPVANSEMPAYIAAMDICLLPRFMWYGSPMKIFEYGAMAKAIVAPDLENIREVLRHGETGLLFEAENVDALIQSTQRLVEDSQLRTKLGVAARQYMLANHTWAKRAEEIIKVYEEISS